MDPATLVSVEEYSHTDYSPDCDYVDGVLEDRNVGKNKHAETQTEIAYFLRRLRERLKIFVLVEQLVQISATRFRVRRSRLGVKIRDYLSVGVRYIWVIDPYSRKAWTYTSEGPVEVKDGVLRTKDPDIEMPLSEVLP